MLTANKRALVLRSPKVGLLNLGGAESKDLVESDADFLRPLFVEVQAVDLPSPRCDVLFLYAEIAADGAVLGADRGLREIIRDSGAKVVIVASPNRGAHYIKAGRQKPYGQANLVMTLDRRGLAFGRFFSRYFLR